MESPINVMLVDDSAVIRGVIARGIATDPGICVVGSASNGQIALSMLDALAPDVVLLDVEMPVMDGLAALPKILAARPGAAVIMASALTRRHAGMSFQALQLGATDYVPKPDAADGPAALTAFFDELRAKIKAHGRRRAQTAGAKPALVAPLGRRAAPTPRLPAAALAIASSTGGPPALLAIFKQLKSRIRTPIFITQHMPATFTALLAEQLGHVSGATSGEGVDGALVQSGAIYVAPGGRHMLAERVGQEVRLRLSDDPPEHFCKPAADPMLRSLARVYGSGLLAVVLTGMGRDGADGCIAVADAGGQFIVQDEASSVVYGMPAAAFKTGRALAQLPLDDIPGYLAETMRTAVR